MKRILPAAVLTMSALLTFQNTSAEDFGIGSKAPEIDVEHWIDSGKGKADPVTKFEAGKIYVVEFWATWCGPCVGSMPHLAEMADKYRNKKVRIISISNEDLETVTEFLKQEGPGAKTFGEITAAYSLTTDPDGSVYADYMDAAGQGGIPHAFIVGTTGEIEWHGHPMTMEGEDYGDPLAKISDGTWDREAYKEQMKEQERLQQLMQKIAQLAQTEKFEEAAGLVEKEMNETKSPSTKSQLEMLLYNLKLNGGMVDEKVKSYFKDKLASTKNVMELGQMSYMIHLGLENGADVGDLAIDAIAALSENSESAPDQIKPMVFMQLAQLYEATAKLPEAIAAQEKAVAASTGQAQKRMQAYLDQLKAPAEEPADEAAAK